VVVGPGLHTFSAKVRSSESERGLTLSPSERLVKLDSDPGFPIFLAGCEGGWSRTTLRWYQHSSSELADGIPFDPVEKVELDDPLRDAIVAPVDHDVLAFWPRWSRFRYDFNIAVIWGTEPGDRDSSLAEPDGPMSWLRVSLHCERAFHDVRPLGQGTAQEAQLTITCSA
jgi:hypothetical protein